MKTINLKEIALLPNLLSLLRIILTVPIVFLIISTSEEYNYLLIVLLLIAAVTDYFDGYFSRKLNQVTELGKILDPIADKISMGIILLAFVFYEGFPLFLVVLLLYRDIMILFFGLFITKKLKRATSANFLGKLNTTLVAICILIFIFSPGTYLLTFFYFLSILSIIVSGINYYFVGEKILLQSRTYKWITRISLSILTIIVLNNFSTWQFSELKESLNINNEDFLNKMELLNVYAPVFYHHTNEKFFPISVDSFIDNSILVKARYFLVFDDILSPGNKIDFNNQTYDNNHYLKINRNIFESIDYKYLENKEAYPSTIYGRAIKIERETNIYYVLQYWIFYWASTAGSSGITWHECDWEVVMFLLDKNQKPIKSGYSQHYYGEVYNWDKTLIEEDRPVVFVSLGGHSMYFKEGKHTSFLDNNKLLPLGSDLCQKGFRMGPENYNLITLDESHHWVNFKGSWGLPITTKLEGPKYRNPKNKRLTMWSNPLEWFNKYESN